jgi:ATPase family associated with various cellular activities (AAA)
VKALAPTLRTTFQRIQFTPDLLPADIIGTQVFRPDNSSFEVKKGPVFHNIILLRLVFAVVNGLSWPWPMGSEDGCKPNTWRG